MRVTVKYGKDTHDLDIDEACTLGALCARLENVTGVPSHLQKIVFKGKSVHAPTPGDDDPKLADALKGFRDGCKLMLLGRKLDPDREALMEVRASEPIVPKRCACERAHGACCDQACVRS